MRWYFEQTRTASPGREPRFLTARRAFGERRFSAVYRAWKHDGEPALVSISSPAIREALDAGRGRIEVLELGHRYGHLSPLAAVS